ncbi:TPA: conjugal transfer protein TraF [Escherichia coli]|nr:conjugal transfer protein TraF [Escherichia coli]HCL6287082.1 conjugal transfer protein TraF [Escherichia coli]
MVSRVTAVILCVLALSSCATNPPQPTLPKGKWIQMNTHVPAAQAQLKKLKAAKAANGGN